MLVNTIELLQKAKKEKYAIPHFNINNLEWTKYILEECNKNNSPVILGVSESAIKYMGGYNVVYSLVQSLIKDLNITIPVALHLDHGTSFESCKKAIDANFTSVMIDASHYSIEENIRITKEVVDYAHKHNVSVEAEIGIISKKNNTMQNKYASIEDCIKLYESTNIDSLAPSVGTMHGLYKENPTLNFNLIKEISEKLNIPLVLHGGTGILDEDIIESIQNGITKININTELQVEWSKSVKEYIKNNDEIYDPRKIISSGEENIKKVVKDKLHILGSFNKI